MKNAIVLISSRLRESQHRDRNHFHGRAHSPDRFFPPDDDYIPHGGARRSSMDGATFGSRQSTSNIRSNNYPSLGYAMEQGVPPVADDAQPFYGEDLIFRMLCPLDKVDRIIGESDGFVEFLQNEVGVDVKVNDPVAGSDEQLIIISSEEVFPLSLSLCLCLSMYCIIKCQFLRSLVLYISRCSEWTTNCYICSSCLSSCNFSYCKCIFNIFST